jgi:hypothetical protein
LAKTHENPYDVEKWRKNASEKCEQNNHLSISFGETTKLDSFDLKHLAGCFLALMIYPSQNEHKKRDDLINALIAWGIKDQEPRPSRRKLLEVHDAFRLLPQRNIETQLNKAFKIFTEKRQGAAFMLFNLLIGAGEPTREYWLENYINYVENRVSTGRIGHKEGGVEIDTIRQRIWRESRPSIHLIYGFMKTTIQMSDFNKQFDSGEISWNKQEHPYDFYDYLRDTRWVFEAIYNSEETLKLIVNRHLNQSNLSVIELGLLNRIEIDPKKLNRLII